MRILYLLENLILKLFLRIRYSLKLILNLLKFSLCEFIIPLFFNSFQQCHPHKCHDFKFLIHNKYFIFVFHFIAQFFHFLVKIQVVLYRANHSFNISLDYQEVVYFLRHVRKFSTRVQPNISNLFNFAFNIFCNLFFF